MATEKHSAPTEAPFRFVIIDEVRRRRLALTPPIAKVLLVAACALALAGAFFLATAVRP